MVPGARLTALRAESTKIVIVAYVPTAQDRIAEGARQKSWNIKQGFTGEV
jgi:hypothetical protein